MAKIKMGAGFKVLTYFIMLLIIVSFSIYSGMKFEKQNQTKSNIEVLKKDSEIAQEITKKTTKNRAKAHEQIENIKNIVDDNGYLSAEFMRALESALADSIKRGDETGFIHAIAAP